jgi:hypothetical protein
MLQTKTKNDNKDERSDSFSVSRRWFDNKVDNKGGESPKASITCSNSFAREVLWSASLTGLAS